MARRRYRAHRHNRRRYYRARRRNRRAFHARRHRRNRRHYAGFHVRRRRLRNPRRGGGVMTFRGAMRNAVMPAALGATGALVFDVAYGYASPFLPAQLQAGWVQVVTKGVFAIGLGLVGQRVLGRERGRVMMLGALTVVAYGALRSALSGAGVPGLSGYSDYTPYPMGAYMRGPTGTPGIQGLGYVSPAAVIGPTMSPRMGAYMPMNVVPQMGDYGDGM